MLHNSLSCFVHKGRLDAFRGEHGALGNGASIQDVEQFRMIYDEPNYTAVT
jgi:hypothetical protein